MASSMPPASAEENHVQDLGQKQLQDLETQLKHVRSQRKSIQKKRKEAQNQLIELERKQVIYTAKQDNALAMKEKSRAELQQLRAAVSARCRTATDLNHQLSKLKQEASCIDEHFEGLKRKADENEEELRKKIEQVKKDLATMAEYQTDYSESLTQFSEELETENEKKRALMVELELMKNKQKFVNQAMDKELQEKLTLEQKFHQLKTQEQGMEQEKQHLQQLIERQQADLSEVMNANAKLTKTGQSLAIEYNAQKNITNKIIRELKCAKHDEENLQEMATLINLKVSNQKIQLHEETEKRTCLLQKIKEREAVQGDEIFDSSCQSTMFEPVIRFPSTSSTYLKPCPSTSSTYLDSSRSHTKPTTDSSGSSQLTAMKTKKVRFESSVTSSCSSGDRPSHQDSSKMNSGSSELTISGNTASNEESN